MAQLRDRFSRATPKGTYYAITRIGPTVLVLLPGTHTSDKKLWFYGEKNTPLSLIGGSSHSAIDAVITLPVVQFTNISVTIYHLQFRNSLVVAELSDHLIVDHAIFDDAHLSAMYVESVSVANTNITITAGARAAYCRATEDYGVFDVSFSDVNIKNVLFSSDHSPCDNDITLLSVESRSLDIADSSFLGKTNHIQAHSGVKLKVSGTVQFHNGRPAIQAQSSAVHLAGYISFINNTGYQRGAIYLGDSYAVVYDNAHVVFLGNHVENVGGAIYSTGNDINNYVSIGMRGYLNFCQISFGENSTVEFTNNTAKSGGSAVYGITTSKMVCGRRMASYEGAHSYTNLFTVLSIKPDDFSAVSSDPLRVCICPNQSTPDCLAILPEQNIPHLHYTVYPGQNFTISAAVVGFNFALTSGSVYAHFLNSDASLLSGSQYVQGVNQTGCSQLQYTVFSDKEQEILVLTSNGRSEGKISSGIYARRYSSSERE